MTENNAAVIPPSKKGAFRASRPPTISESMIPDGTTLKGKILKIEIPKESKFKSPMITLETEDGRELNVPGWASIMNVVGKESSEWKECVGHNIWITKLGKKKSDKFGKEFQVFDVVIV